jgi:hypothetical protein
MPERLKCLGQVKSFTALVLWRRTLYGKNVSGACVHRLTRGIYVPLSQTVRAGPADSVRTRVALPLAARIDQ